MSHGKNSGSLSSDNVSIRVRFREFQDCEESSTAAHAMSSGGTSLNRLDAFQPRVGIAELVLHHAEAVHQRQIEAAHFALVFAVAEIAERATGLQGAAQ